MSYIFLLFSVLLVVASSVSDDKFLAFMKKYNKTYSSDEYPHRLQVFKENVKRAEVMYEKDPKAEWGITKFMDLSPNEFRSMYLIKNFTSPKKEGKTIPVFPKIEVDKNTVPAAFDWNSRGVVTAVYNQGNCGSCWAFSTTENVESMRAIAGKGLINLSMQQLVDCAGAFGNHGCDGGNPPWAFEYIRSAGGLEAFKDYPYAGVDQACHFDAAKIAARIGGWTYITESDDEEAMLGWTYTRGPPSVCVDASLWQYYTGGVVTPASGCGTQLDHCVMITGWQTVEGAGVWNVRNEWGTDWGYGGYIYIEMGYDVCGIGQEVQSCII